MVEFYIYSASYDAPIKALIVALSAVNMVRKSHYLLSHFWLDKVD